MPNKIRDQEHYSDRTQWLDEYIRKHVLSKYNDKVNVGLTKFDIDLVVRLYTKQGTRSHYGQHMSSDGRFGLVEYKNGSAGLSPPQDRTLRLINNLLIRADPNSMHYRGFFLVSTKDVGDFGEVLSINRKAADLKGYTDFLKGKICYPAMSGFEATAEQKSFGVTIPEENISRVAPG